MARRAAPLFRREIASPETAMSPALMMRLARARIERAKERQFEARATVERTQAIWDAIEFCEVLLERLAERPTAKQPAGSSKR